MNQGGQILQAEMLIPELGTCGFLVLYFIFLSFSINNFLLEAGCFNSPWPKEGYFQSWALVVLY